MEVLYLLFKTCMASDKIPGVLCRSIAIIVFANNLKRFDLHSPKRSLREPQSVGAHMKCTVPSPTLNPGKKPQRKGDEERQP